MVMLYSSACFAQKLEELDRKIALHEPWKQASPTGKKFKYPSIQVDHSTIILFGKQVELDKNGFPKQIMVYFNDSLTQISPNGQALLAENIHFHFVRKSDGKTIKLIDEGATFILLKAEKVIWKAKSSNDSLRVDVMGMAFANGELAISVKVEALKDIDFKDVTLHLPFQKSKADLLSGFGQPGGLRPEKVEWSVSMAQKGPNACWIGNSTAGLQYALILSKDKKDGWWNGAKGGATVAIKGSSMLANNYTGPHYLRKGEVRHYDFTLLPTPVKVPVDN